MKASYLGTSFCLTIASLLTITAPADAQLVSLHSFEQGALAGCEGSSSLGDVTGDGHPDYALGSFISSEANRVFVVSGADGALVAEIVAGGSTAHFGAALAGVGDVDLDGTPDMAVGVPELVVLGSKVGRVRVFSGASFRELYRVDGAIGDRLGASVAGLGDVDGDGRPDILAGAKGNAQHSGRAVLLSGVDGETLHAWSNEIPGAQFGYSVTNAGDLDGDGVADLAVGAPFETKPGHEGEAQGIVRVYSSAGKGLLLTLAGDPEDAEFGWIVRGLGDADGDDVPDLAVGTRANRAWLASGANGSLRVIPGPGSTFGQTLAALGDADGDGLGDLVVGRFGTNVKGGSGPAFGYSGASTDRIFSTTGGETLLGAGDVDLDGVVDVGTGESTPFGAFFVMRSTRTRSCLGVGNAVPGAPSLVVDGPLTPGSALDMTLTRAPSTAPTWIVIGFALGGPGAISATSPVPALVIPTTTDAHGNWSITVHWPSLDAPLPLVVQAWSQDDAAATGLIASNTVSCLGCPALCPWDE